MRWMSLAGAFLVASVTVGCTAGPAEKQGGSTAQPTVTKTSTVTKPAPPAKPKPKPTKTVTKSAPPPEARRTVEPPVAPTPAGPAGSCSYTGSQPTIRIGSNGAAVQQAQCYINLSLADEAIPEDGDFGPVTEAATKRFQRCAGITVDGLIGPETWSHLTYWASSSTYVC